MKVVIFILILTMAQSPGFKETQLKYDRVGHAYALKETIVKNYFRDKKINQKGFHLFIRVLKKEQKLEVWVKEKGQGRYALLHDYKFCTTSGVIGPKRKEGDMQIPEGIYHVNHFNPVSNFFLSLGINYPNASDRILSDRLSPGGAIYIHGNCVTIGCIPLTDDKIKELYVMAVEARNNGQEKIPVHIFPFGNLTTATLQEYAENENLNFWENLRPLYEDFENTKTLRPIRVDRLGRYQWNDSNVQ